MRLIGASCPRLGVQCGSNTYVQSEGAWLNLDAYHQMMTITQARSHATIQPCSHAATQPRSLGCALVSHRVRKDGTTTAEREGHADAVKSCDAMKLEGSSCPPGTKAMKQQATQLSHPSFSICSAHDANRMVCGAPQTDEALFQHHLDQWSRRRHDESAREGDNSEGVPSRAKTCQDLHRWLRQVNLRCGQGESFL